MGVRMWYWFVHTLVMDVEFWVYQDNTMILHLCSAAWCGTAGKI